MSLPSRIRGDSALYSTALDYSQFLRMLLNGGQLQGRRFLSEVSFQNLTRNQLGAMVVQQQQVADPSVARPYPLGAGSDGWSFGFQIAAPGVPSPTRRRPGSYGWAGIYNTFFWVDPEKQIGVVLLMQVLPFYDERCLEVLSGFEEQVYTHLN